MQAETRRARGEHAADLLRAAIEREAVAGAARRRHGAGGGQFLEDDVDDAADVRISRRGRELRP